MKCMQNIQPIYLSCLGARVNIYIYIIYIYIYAYLYIYIYIYMYIIFHIFPIMDWGFCRVIRGAGLNGHRQWHCHFQHWCQHPSHARFALGETTSACCRPPTEPPTTQGRDRAQPLCLHPLSVAPLTRKEETQPGASRKRCGILCHIKPPLFLYMYVYIYVYTHIHIYICRHVHMYIYMYMCIQI